MSAPSPALGPNAGRGPKSVIAGSGAATRFASVSGRGGSSFKFKAEAAPCLRSSSAASLTDLEIFLGPAPAHEILMHLCELIRRL